jgi:hypothetical protein
MNIDTNVVNLLSETVTIVMSKLPLYDEDKLFSIDDGEDIIKYIDKICVELNTLIDSEYIILKNILDKYGRRKLVISELETTTGKKLIDEIEDITKRKLTPNMDRIIKLKKLYNLLITINKDIDKDINKE